MRLLEFSPILHHLDQLLQHFFCAQLFWASQYFLEFSQAKAGLLPQHCDIAIAQAVSLLSIEFERVQFLFLTAKIVHATCMQVSDHKVERRVVLDFAGNHVDFFEDEGICVCDFILRNERSLEKMGNQNSSRYSFPYFFWQHGKVGQQDCNTSLCIDSYPSPSRIHILSSIYILILIELGQFQSLPLWHFFPIRGEHKAIGAIERWCTVKEHDAHTWEICIMTYALYRTKHTNYHH